MKSKGSRGRNSARCGGDLATQEDTPGFPLAHSPTCSHTCSITWPVFTELPLLARHCAGRGGRAEKSQQWPWEAHSQDGEADRSKACNGAAEQEMPPKSWGQGAGSQGRVTSASGLWAPLSHGPRFRPRWPICCFVFVIFISGFVFSSFSQQRAFGKIPPLFQLDSGKGRIVRSSARRAKGCQLLGSPGVHNRGARGRQVGAREEHGAPGQEWGQAGAQRAHVAWWLFPDRSSCSPHGQEGKVKTSSHLRNPVHPGSLLFPTRGPLRGWDPESEGSLQYHSSSRGLCVCVWRSWATHPTCTRTCVHTHTRARALSC